MFNFIKRGKVIFGVSLVLIIASIGVVSIFGLKLGLDFTGGTLEEISFSGNRPSIEEVSLKLSETDVKDIKIQESGERNLILRAGQITPEQHDQILAKLKEQFGETGGEIKDERFETIGPTVGEELKTKTLFATLAVVGAILLYVAYAFRKVTEPSSWVYGGAAVVALFHDLAITSGVFALLGRFQGVEIDTLFVTALLTTLGFSVNDTIVVFDRIRENRLHNKGENFESIVNRSINETIVRSLNTSFTTLLALLALLFFGGESIRYFVIALIIGIAAGSYSSIFVASPILVFWQRRKTKKAL